MKEYKVRKRNGSLEPIDISKITKSLEWASKGLKKVSVSDVEMAANLHFYDGISTEEIHDIMLKTVKDKISLKTPDYDKMAAKLLIQKICKEAVGNVTPPPSMSKELKQNEIRGYYRNFFDIYTEKEINELATYIKPLRDFKFSLAGLEQLVDKYMIKDKDKGKVIETPQIMFMAIAMDMFHDYDKNSRMKLVKDMYDALSLFKVSLPTPMMKSLRTCSTDYASCVTITIGDSIESWTLGKSAIVKHTVASAGIGVDVSTISSINDIVRNGTIKHPGKIPVMRAVDADIQMASQNGRRGQAVAYVNFFDPEIETILSLKSPRTETQKRINDLKYAIKTNGVFYKRIKEGKGISLFSPRKQKELIRLFNSKDIEGFIKEYERLEEQGLADGYIHARDLVDIIITERFENGVYYFFNVDEANRNTTYKEPIYQSNICMEFISPTRPISEDIGPDIGVCILSNINQGTVSVKELPHYTNLLVRGLNNIIHRQTQPTPHANEFVRQYTSLGIGFANHAYFLAKNDCKFGSQKGMDLHDEWMEHFQYGLIKASNDLAKEGIVAPLFHKTTYTNGIMPIDRYKKTVDELTNRAFSLDWDSLRKDVVKYGLANCTLSMIPPSETSSVVGNMTSGMEPIRDLITIKSSKTSTLVQLAPDAISLADKYDFAFDREITKDFLKHVAITQKWICQGISANTFYNPELYENNKVPQKLLLQDIFFSYYYGNKTLYYNNVYIKDEENQQQSACAGEGCAV